MIIALQQLEPDITLEGISTVMYIFNFEYTFAFHELRNLGIKGLNYCGFFTSQRDVKIGT